MVNEKIKEEAPNIVCRDGAVTIQFNDAVDSVNDTINALTDLKESGAISSFFLCLMLKNKQNNNPMLERGVNQ